MYNGTLSIIYIGDDTGDTNLPLTNLTVDATMEAVDRVSVKLMFDLPIDGLEGLKQLTLNIRDYAAFTDPVRLFIDDVIKVDIDDYVLTGLMIYNTDNGIEQFRLIGRFNHGIPEGINVHISPFRNS
jgi:hypothetical protein